MGLLRTLAIIIAFYYLFKFLVKIFSVQGQSYAQASHGRTERQEGDVTIENPNVHKTQGKSKDKGKYVDYEEVD